MRDVGQLHTLDDGLDGTLLDGGGALETVSVDTWNLSVLFKALHHICNIPLSNSGFRFIASKESVTSS